MTAAIYIAGSPGVTSRPFGDIGDGRVATLYSLRNSNGMQVDISDLGGLIVSLWAADAEGVFADVVLGFDQARDYLHNPGRFGAVIGRYAGRIAGAAFAIAGETYKLKANQGNNHLHGGDKGFDRRLWTGETFHSLHGIGLRLSLQSPDGEEGFPGALDVTVTYRLDDENRLQIDYHAVSDRPTILNLTQHSYFNLGGPRERDILSHRLCIEAESYLPLNADIIPTGEICPVADTPMDFRKAKAIGQDLNAASDQIALAGGYDHCWVLAREKRQAPVLAAQVHHPVTRRRLTLWTDQPGLQFYTANALDGSVIGKGGTPYGRRQGLCFETQNFPDAPNHPNFPSPLLQAGEDYASRTIFQFDIHHQESTLNDPVSQK